MEKMRRRVGIPGGKGPGKRDNDSLCGEILSARILNGIYKRESLEPGTQRNGDIDRVYRCVDLAIVCASASFDSYQEAMLKSVEWEIVEIAWVV